MGNGLAEATLEPSDEEFDGTKTNRQLLNHKIEVDERHSIESADQLNISSRLFKPIESPPEFIEMNFDF